MRILAIERELSAAIHPIARETLRDEATAVWALKKRDIVRDLWFTADHHRAVLLLECRNAGEAGQILAGLPLVRAGHADFTLLELQPYDGFERLFTAEVASALPKREPPPEY